MGCEGLHIAFALRCAARRVRHMHTMHELRAWTEDSKPDSTPTCLGGTRTCSLQTKLAGLLVFKPHMQQAM